MLPYSAFDPAAITFEIDAVPRCHDFGSYVPFGLLQSKNVTTLCSTGYQLDINVTDAVNAVDRCCANIECDELGLVQSRPRPRGLVFQDDGFSLRPLPPSL